MMTDGRRICDYDPSAAKVLHYAGIHYSVFLQETIALYSTFSYLLAFDRLIAQLTLGLATPQCELPSDATNNAVKHRATKVAASSMSCGANTFQKRQDRHIPPRAREVSLVFSGVADLL